MEKRPLSQNPSAIASRERRENTYYSRLEREWNAEVGAYMKAHGVDYDTAFVACGGSIYSDKDLKQMAVDALLKTANENERSAT